MLHQAFVDDLRQYSHRDVLRVLLDELAHIGPAYGCDRVDVIRRWLDEPVALDELAVGILPAPPARSADGVTGESPYMHARSAAYAAAVIDHGGTHAPFLTESDFVYEHVAMAWATALAGATGGDLDEIDAGRARFVMKLGPVRRTRVGVHFAVHRRLPEIEGRARELGWVETLGGAARVRWQELHWTTDDWSTQRVLHSSQRPAMTWRGWFILAGVEAGACVEFAIKVGLQAMYVEQSDMLDAVWINNGGANYHQVARHVERERVAHHGT